MNPLFAEVISGFLYAPAMLYIASHQTHTGVRRVMEVMAITTLIYSGVKIQYNMGIEKKAGG